MLMYGGVRIYQKQVEHLLGEYIDPGLQEELYLSSMLMYETQNPAETSRTILYAQSCLC